MLCQAEFGLADADDSMRTVRKFVEGLWMETNRLNARETREILSDMFYLSASLGSAEVSQLLALWGQMVEESKRKGRMVFLETQRLALIPFHQVFIGSDALQLAVCHYVRSPADETDRTDEYASRGGITRQMLSELMAICLVAEDQVRPP